MFDAIKKPTCLVIRVCILQLQRVAEVEAGKQMAQEEAAIRRETRLAGLIEEGKKALTTACFRRSLYVSVCLQRA